MTFIGAGSDTPAMTIAWCLYTMIKHPDAQVSVIPSFTFFKFWPKS